MGDHPTTQSHKSFEESELKAKLLWYKLTLWCILSNETMEKTWYKVFKEIFLSSSMPLTQAYLLEHGFKKRKPLPFAGLCIDVVFRGISQVFLCNHPLCGVFICIGLSWTTYQLPLYALLGTAVATASAVLVARPPQEDILAGLCGYDGALVGCSCFTFLLAQEALTSAVLLSLLTGIVHVAVTNLMKIWQLPSFTLAFNIVMIMMLYAIQGDVVALHFSDTPATKHSPAFTDMSAQFAVDATIRGVGQFMFASTTVGSAWVVAGIAVCSRKGAAIACLGSVIGWVLSLYVLHVHNVANVRSGLFGYNCAGTCSVLAGGIFYKASDGAVLVGVCGACFAALLTVGFGGMFDGLPVLTFPFITSAWIIMLSRSKWLDVASDGLLRPLMRRISSKQMLSTRAFKIPLLDYYPKVLGGKESSPDPLERIKSSGMLQRMRSNSFIFNTPQRLSRVGSVNGNDQQYIDSPELNERPLFLSSNSRQDSHNGSNRLPGSFKAGSQKLSFKSVAKAIVEAQKEIKEEESGTITMTTAGQVYRFDEADESMEEV